MTANGTLQLNTASDSRQPLIAAYDAEIDIFVSSARAKRPQSRLVDPTRLKQVKDEMERVFRRQTILFCVDVEAWERDTKQVTEIGVSIYDPRGQELALTPVLKNIHIIIAENQRRKNGRFVPEHSGNFSGHTSHLLSRSDACSYLRWLIDVYFHADFECTLVGHDIRGDVKWLAELGVELPRTAPLLDTQRLFAASHGKHGASLKNALVAVQQPFAFLHNAGNDAYYTVLLALRLCDPAVRRKTQLDVQPPDEDPDRIRKHPKQANNRSFLARSTREELEQYVLN